MGEGAGFPDLRKILLLLMGVGRLVASDPVPRLGLMPGSVTEVSVLVFQSIYSRQAGGFCPPRNGDHTATDPGATTQSGSWRYPQRKLTPVNWDVYKCTVCSVQLSGRLGNK